MRLFRKLRKRDISRPGLLVQPDAFLCRSSTNDEGDEIGESGISLFIHDEMSEVVEYGEALRRAMPMPSGSLAGVCVMPTSAFTEARFDLTQEYDPTLPSPWDARHVVTDRCPNEDDRHGLSAQSTLVCDYQR